jgi:hypothetical protein
MFSRRFYFRFLFEYSLHGLCFPSLINHSWAAVAAAAASEAAEAGLNELMEDDLFDYLLRLEGDFTFVATLMLVFVLCLLSES